MKPETILIPQIESNHFKNDDPTPIIDYLKRNGETVIEYGIVEHNDLMSYAITKSGYIIFSNGIKQSIDSILNVCPVCGSKAIFDTECTEIDNVLYPLHGVVCSNFKCHKQPGTMGKSILDVIIEWNKKSKQ